MSAVATIRPTVMRRRTSTRPPIRSSRAMTRPKVGAGATSTRRKSTFPTRLSRSARSHAISEGEGDEQSQAVRADHDWRPRSRKPDYHRVDVPIFGDRWPHDRLAPDPPGPPRSVSRRTANYRGDGGPSRGADPDGDVSLYEEATEAAMARTANCSTSFCLPSPTGEAICMAAASKTGCAFRSRYSKS